MLAKKLKRMMNAIGFTIQRTHTGKNFKFDSDANPLYIEFIGVSGVGKTTLYNEVKKVREGVKWIERYDFLTHQPKINTDEHINTNMLQMLEKKSDNIWESNINLTDKIKLLNFVYQNISEEVSAQHYNKNATLINEDGLFHNFGRELKQLYADDRFFFNELCKNRAVVFCTNSPENIAKNIQNRNKDFKAIRPHHRLDSLEDLIKIQHPLLKETEDFVKILRGNDVPVLVIQTDADISKNAHKINLFIKDLQLRTE